jgi:formiminotetrahydrofolate cyclodeaminase
MSDTWGSTKGDDPNEAGFAVPSTTAGWLKQSTAAQGPPPKVPIENPTVAGSRIGPFLDAVASDSPTPGGGAWAGVTAAAGAALIAMVARLTIKKKGFEGVIDRMQAIAAECDDERYALLGLADRDAEAYREVMAAYRMPKETSEETHARAVVLQKALERAADIPLEVARRAAYLLTLAEEVLTSGNPNAASDALSAAAALHAATISALANVDINAITFLDKTRQEELRESANSLRHRAQSLMREVEEAFLIAMTV